MIQLAFVGFEDLEVECIIGVHVHERSQKQLLSVDLSAEIDVTRVISSDALKDSLDYCGLVAIVKSVVNQEHHMLEKLAAEIVAKVLSNPSVKRARLKIKKPAALNGARFAFVEMEARSGD